MGHNNHLGGVAMLEAILWFTGFVLLSALTWFAGKHYGEKIAMHKTMERHGFKDVDFYSSPLDHIVTKAVNERKTSETPKLYLVAKNGRLLDAPQETTLKEKRRRSL